jgi:hypothetical protein
MAARADCCRTFARSHDYFDALLVGTETGVLIDKTSETMAAVQDRVSSMAAKPPPSIASRPKAHDFGKP